MMEIVAENSILQPGPIRRTKLYELVTQKLENMIRSGELKPGDKLPSERDIMAAFNIGRPAVREALLSLQSRGLIVTENGRVGPNAAVGQQIASIARSLYARGWMPGTAGNISVRTGQAAVITGSGLSKGELTADDMVTVSDAELVRAMLYLWERMKIIVEPTGALGAAGLFERCLPVAGKRVGVILSGGNADFKLIAKYF